MRRRTRTARLTVAQDWHRQNWRWLAAFALAGTVAALLPLL